MTRILTLVLFVALFSCKEAKKESSSSSESVETLNQEIERDYPESFVKVLESHGSLKTWKKQKTLTFELLKPNGNEVHTIDLHSRKDRIDIADISMGYDGSEIWLKDEKESYRGNAVVYHNLMFYFYAMPFVFADPGVNYEMAEPLEFEGKYYPGIHMSYNDGVGASSKDDYYLHYDPETFQMAWLGYTFTFGSDEKSNDVRWIRYNDWIKINGVLLPKSMAWHNYEGRTIKEAKDPTTFENISLTESSKPERFYEKPENAKIVLKP
ncbi:hypothetical protein B0O79_0519 [Flavobacteriaceae bacterium MAR_2009_75]|nr:hypothetical protein B0O79_0519 [Flavobacteriaceae bacterium MAR_2009_75]